MLRLCSPMRGPHPLEVLPHDSKSRRLFVTNGGLKRVQELKADPGSVLQEYINNINGCFSEEMVRWDRVVWQMCCCMYKCE